MDWLGLFIAAVTTATLVAAWLTLRTARRSFTWMKRSRQEDRAPLVTAKFETGWSPARKATLSVEVVNESTFDVVVRNVEFCVSGLEPIRFRSSIGPAVPLDAGAHRGYVMEIERDSLSSRLSGRAAKDVWIDVRSNTAELCRIDGGEIIEKLSKLGITA